MAKRRKPGRPGLVSRGVRAYQELPARVLMGAAEMADEVLGTNPKRRRKTGDRRRAKKPPTAKQLAARRKFAAMSRARARSRKRLHSRNQPAGRVTARKPKGRNPGVVRFTEAEARRYGDKIKGLSGGSRRSKTRTTTGSGRRFKRAGLFSGSGRFGLGRSRQTIRARNAATRTGIFEKFQGRPSDPVKTRAYPASDFIPGDTDTLGGLEEIVVKQQGRPVKIVRFSPTRHALAASRGMAGRFKLHLLGPRFTHRANPGELADIGDIHKVVYVATKSHIDGRKVHYTHKLKAPYPKLCVDHEGRPVIKDPLGGRKIDERGIID